MNQLHWDGEKLSNMGKIFAKTCRYELEKEAGLSLISPTPPVTTNSLELIEICRRTFTSININLNRWRTFSEDSFLMQCYWTFVLVPANYCIDCLVLLKMFLDWLRAWESELKLLQHRWSLTLIWWKLSLQLSSSDELLSPHTWDPNMPCTKESLHILRYFKQICCTFEHISSIFAAHFKIF